MVHLKNLKITRGAENGSGKQCKIPLIRLYMHDFRYDKAYKTIFKTRTNMAVGRGIKQALKYPCTKVSIFRMQFSIE